MEGIHSALLHWAHVHGLVGVFAFMFTENLCMPFPTEVGFIAAQLLVSSGRVPYWLAFLVITAGHVAGAAVSYYAGRAGENVLVRRFGHSRSFMRAREVLQTWYARYGALTVLFGRLVGHVRPWASLAAGMGQVPPVTFWVWTVIGSMIYSAAAMWITAVGWEWVVRHPQWRVPIIIAALVLFYGVIASGLAVKLVQRWRRRRAKLTAGAAAGESTEEGCAQREQ
ncbi:MAG: DedA family protein [Armatimonadetes bacterium]|nr:DedA family protein [Armatimonadota bacterium]